MVVAPANSPPKTLALIIGAGKTATTSLFHYLAQHPDIRPSSPKEVNFFSLHWDKGLDWYWAHFPGYGSGSGNIFLDASPSYSNRHKRDGVPERIASLGVPVKLIYTVRHPVERIRSHASHKNAQGIEGPRVDAPTLTPSADEIDKMIEHTRYGFQLEFFERLFPGQILVLSVDELKADHVGTLDRVTDFLGLERFSPKDSRTRNRISDLYARPWVKRVRRGPFGPVIKALVPEGLRRKVVKSASHKPPEVVITPEAERRILDAVRPDLIHLKTHYGIDATALWGIPL